jgi:hypothetical protein
MPPSLVTPGLEKYWTKAKELAAEQGRAEDWAYIVGIFKRMTMNKSEEMEKAGPYYGPQGGKYEDPQHKIPWKDKGATPAGEAKKVKAAVGKLFPGMFVGVEIGDRGYQLEFAPTAADAGPLARIQTDGRVQFTVAPRGLKPWPDGVAAMATDSQTKEQLKLMGIKAPRKTSTTADKAGQALVRWFEKNVAVLRRGKAEELKKSDLRTSPVLHVIQRWPGQVPDRRGLEANLMLRKVKAWSTPRPDPQVTQVVPTAQYAVSNLGLDSRTEGEWVRFLENVVYPNVPEVKVRQAVLEKMMSDRMDPALRSVMWSRVAALVKHVCRGDEQMEKAGGPIARGKRGGKIYGYDKRGKPIYSPPEEKKQLTFKFSPAAKLEKKDPGAEYKRLAEKMVDAKAADLAWAR